MNASLQIGASPFEILTATAFTIFNDANVKLGVIEVGMGGKLDATNILNNQAVSVISKISRDHEAFLGNTLSEIATHKAGILRPNVPYLVTSANESNVVNVINDYADEIGAGPRLTTGSFDFQKRLYFSSKWERITRGMAPFQQENMKLAAVAVMQAFQAMEKVPSRKEVKPMDIAKTLLANVKIRQPGRQEMVQVPPVFRRYGMGRNMVLIDGAHNPDAAEALDQIVQDKLRFGKTPARDRPASGWPVTWVLAMTEGKDAHEYLARLLKPGDKVITTAFGPVDGMPWVKPMDPRKLLDVAKSAQPEITGMHMPFLGVLRALSAAKYLADQMANWAPIAMTGSLYLIGDFYREMRERPPGDWWHSQDEAVVADRLAMFKMQAMERERVDSFLKYGLSAPSPEQEEKRRLQEEIDAVSREVQGLEIVEQRLAAPTAADLSTGGEPPSALELFDRDEQRFAEKYATPQQIADAIAKAEKAEADLVAREAGLHRAAEARAKKAERRAQLKERAAERAERRREARAKRQKEPLAFFTPERGWQTVKFYKKSEEEEFKTSLERVQRAREQRIQLREQTEHPFKPTWRPFQPSSQPSQPSWAQDEAEVASPSSAPAAQHATAPQHDTAPQTPPAVSPLPRLHMHYAHHPEPRRSKTPSFPHDRRTRAWSKPRAREHPGYKHPGRPSVVNYSPHEYGMRTSGGAGRGGRGGRGEGG